MEFLISFKFIIVISKAKEKAFIITSIYFNVRIITSL